MPNDASSTDNDFARHALVAGLLYRATSLATAAASEEEACEVCVAAVLDRTGWHCGHVWRVISNGELAHVGSWFNADHSPNADHTDTSLCSPERRLLVRVCESRDVAWSTSEEAADISQGRTHLQVHTKTALAIPVSGAEGQVRLVLEFQHTEPVERSEDTIVFCRLVAEILARVTERQEVAERLAEAKDAAEAANRAKSDFLAKMSHELRTPLNVILGMIQLALQKDLPAEVVEYLETAKQSSHELLSGLNDLLDVSNLEHEANTVEFEPVDILQIVEHAVNRFRNLADHKKLRLEIDVGESVPPQVLTDGVRLQEVLHKLLDNAIKFTDEGEVAIRVAAAAEALSEVVLHFEIVDTGPGIAGASLQELMKPFAQATMPPGGETPGAGLGLAVCQKLLADLGTELSVTSEPGRGSSFRFELTAATTDPTSEPTGTEPKTDGAASLAILLAEDMPANQKLVTSILRNHSRQVTVANNGCEAIDHVLGGDFDLVLMDVRMPVMDGYEATKAIREAEQRSGKHVPIIAMTAHAGHRDREACLRAGMDDYLSKPIDIHELTTVIDRWARKSAAPKASQSASAARHPDDRESAVNFADAMKRLHGDRKLFQEFVEVFNEDAPVLLQAMSGALAVADTQQLSRAAHSLRGLAVNLGAERVAHLAAMLEQHADSNDSASAHDTLDTLSQAVDQLQVSLNQLGT